MLSPTTCLSRFLQCHVILLVNLFRSTTTSSTWSNHSFRINIRVGGVTIHTPAACLTNGGCLLCDATLTCTDTSPTPIVLQKLGRRRFPNAFWHLHHYLFHNLPWRSQHFPACCHLLHFLPAQLPIFPSLDASTSLSVLEHTVCPFPLTQHAKLASNFPAYPGMVCLVLSGRRCPTFARQAFRRSAITWGQFPLRILADRPTSTLR